MINALTELLNQQSIDERDIKNSTMKKIDIDDIQANDLNLFPIAEIQELAESIKKHGLLHPLVVYQNIDNDTYMLISGHRRLSAIQAICRNDKDFSTQVNCVVIPKPRSTITEKELVYLGNKNRPPLNDSEMLSAVRDLMATWESKQPNERKGSMRDYIAQYLNVSSKTLQKYINQIRIERGEREKEDEVVSKKLKAKKRTLKDMKKMSNIASDLENFIDIYHESLEIEGKKASINEWMMLLSSVSEAIAQRLEEIED